MEQEYLVSYGSLGDFGRFRTTRPLPCRRGDRAVVRSHRGVEAGQVLGAATSGHAPFLPNTSVGALLRLATPADERALENSHTRGQELFTAARGWAADLALPLEVLDVEVLLDNDHAVLLFVRWDECDLREFVSGLSKRFSLHVLLQDLTRPSASAPNGAAVEHGCGSCGAGGCGSCGAGGCGNCSTAGQGTQAHFASLREQMMAHNRTPLL